LSKLTYYGIISQAKHSPEIYFRDRCQRVQITNSNLNQNTFFSKWAKAKHGIPQGSTFGPVLFLLYINDLPKVIESKATPIVFVYDTSMLITSRNTTKQRNDTNIVFKQINNAATRLAYIESFFQANRDCEEDISMHVVALRKLFVYLNEELTKHNENTLSERMLTRRVLTTLSTDYDNCTMYGIPSVQTNRR